MLLLYPSIIRKINHHSFSNSFYILFVYLTLTQRLQSTTLRLDRRAEIRLASSLLMREDAS